MLSSVWKEASPCPPLSCWANGSVSTVREAPKRPCASRSPRLVTPSLCSLRSLRHQWHASSKRCFIYLHEVDSVTVWNLRCCRCVSAWRTHPPSLSKTRYCHNWPVRQVSCWKSRFCTDVRPVALRNHVHTQPGFNCTLEGNTQGLSGFYFKVPFQGKLAAQAEIQMLPTFGLNYSDVSLLIVLFRKHIIFPCHWKATGI